MILTERPPRERRRGRRPSVLRIVLVAVAVVLAFVLGIAFARALDDGPKQGGLVTSVRTLTPLPQRPATRTVTVTVTAP